MSELAMRLGDRHPWSRRLRKLAGIAIAAGGAGVLAHDLARALVPLFG